MIEPSNAEQAEWPDTTRDYVTALQAENEKLREALLAHKEVAKDYAADALRLREALEYIAETSDDQHISRKAFETLEPKP